jgi:membrane associated rhomboid family serine protease
VSWFPWRVDTTTRWPVGTLGLVAVSVLVPLLLFEVLSIPELRKLVVWLVEIAPVTWFAHLFLVEPSLHLVGVAFFLWIFGRLIEERARLRGLLLIYFGSGIASAAVTNVVFLGAEGGLAGPDAGVHGLMAASAIWAPRRQMTVFHWVLLNFEIHVYRFCVLLLCWDAFVLLAVAPLVGPAYLVWLVIAILLSGGMAVVAVQRGWVDCEGEDVFSLRRKRGEYWANVEARRNAREEREREEGRRG